MWLINCRTLLLEEFLNHKEARYAILSHTWEKGEEVQYGEFNNREATGKRGWQKIENTCQLALNDGCDFAWVDTCCIDKTSSAELTEAINSMFPWYSRSEICYIYLADYDASNPVANMSESRWFTRGWTLQELIAPAQVRFYDKSWNSIGTKDTLSQQLSLITGIGQEILLASKNRNLEEVLDQVPVARRMSWAAKRETTRVEDTAYCLIGIFAINLPLLYGEGERAFIRLQEEVVKNSNDLSLLAWRSPKDETPTNLDRICGVFARHPRDFQASDNLVLINDIKFTPEFTMTNKGLKIHTQLYFDRTENLHFLGINCYDVDFPQEIIGIFLKHQGASIFARARPHLFASLKTKTLSAITENKLFFLSKSITPGIANSLHSVRRCSFFIPQIEHFSCHFKAATPEVLWDSAQRMFITVGLQDFVGCHEYSLYENEGFCVVFGYGYGYDPWVRIFPSAVYGSLVGGVKDGKWREVAQSAHWVTSDHLDFAKAYKHLKQKWSGLGSCRVNLEQSIQGGEPVYTVRLTRKGGQGDWTSVSKSTSRSPRPGRALN